MPMNSVNTNVGAMVALQNLNSTNTALATTQDRINTGLKVGSAKDNGAIWAIAQNQRATSQSLDSVKESLQRGSSTVDVAIAAGESISDLLLQMKAKALSASDTTLDTNSRIALNDDFKSLRDQIQKAVDNAEFNGANMIKATASQPTTVMALANADGNQFITVQAQDLSLGSAALTDAVGGGTIDDTSSIATQTMAQNMIATVNAAIIQVSSALSKLGTGSKSLNAHLNFVGKLQDTLDAGVGNLVDADLAKESARLQALQTKQQLGVQALSIANQSSGTLMSLFRG
ncbi:flagellin [Phenylobacterium sp. LjRoot219]|uniref:flagellin N-terminal helical domain-containing protein n=1 Tax=Phenylobacterium sp. LjRoot219 TaxID=3342283 RepID=UPI003ECD251E